MSFKKAKNRSEALLGLFHCIVNKPCAWHFNRLVSSIEEIIRRSYTPKNIELFHTCKGEPSASALAIAHWLKIHVTHYKSISSMIRLVQLAFPEYMIPFGYDQVRYRAFNENEHALTSYTSTNDEDALYVKLFTKLSSGALGMPICEACFGVLNVIDEMVEYRLPGGSWHDMAQQHNFIIKNLNNTVNTDTELLKLWKDIGDFTSKEKDLMADFVGLVWAKHIENYSKDTEFCIALPELWRPNHSYKQTLLQTATQKILWELWNEKKPLRKVHWRTLEEIVAELLSSLGLSVSLTKRTHDGGRDIIARGELIPGEPTSLAVEVKQQGVVGITDIRSAIHANRHFPALLIATAGHFSAGVFSEKQEKELCLRLFLKDGLALEQWLDIYASRHDWKAKN